MKYYLFPKFFKHLSVKELMEHCVKSNINGPTALIREGYWLTPNNYIAKLPEYIRCAEKFDLKVKYADLPFSINSLIKDPTPLKILSENGILYARMGYVSKKEKDARELYSYTKNLAKKVSNVAQRNNIKVIIQIHGGCYPHNATAAYPIVKELNPNYIGIKLDPGNNYCQEGYEDFSYQINLLNEYIAAVGAKDACSIRKNKSERKNKGWKRMFVPAYEGQSNFDLIYSMLKQIKFDGPMILMPFYNQDNFKLLFDNFKKEVKYFKKIGATR